MTWLSLWIFTRAEWWAGRYRTSRMRIWSSKALDMAYEQRAGPRASVSTPDQGSYGSRQFRQRLWRYRMRQSIEPSWNIRWDNAPMERVFRSLKTEWIPTVGMTAQSAPRHQSFLMHRQFSSD
ncbi:hypothetical protein [Pseudomonas baetica]|uniref:hypothetical protein n=1 Tax=Pseudomonas baetica TaxID=674054 RepID=UPI001EDE2451|nr:hypothetical protein [Pseudomonas baetica]